MPRAEAKKSRKTKLKQSRKVVRSKRKVVRSKRKVVRSKRKVVRSKRKVVRSKRKVVRSKRKVVRAKRKGRQTRWPPMSLENVNTREKLSVSIFDRRGRTDRRAVKKLYKFLRCARTGRRHRIAWRLLRNLYSVSRAFPGKKIYVYSGYRYKRRSRRSRHNRGQAIDFRVAGVPNHKLQAFVRTRFKRVGVGYYPRSFFVHMDVRSKRSAFWVDYSGPGQRPRYARDPYGAMASELKRLASKGKASTGRKLKALAKVSPRPKAAAASVVTGSAPEASGKIALAVGGAEPAGSAPGGEPDEAEDDPLRHAIAGPAPVGPVPGAASSRGMPGAPPR